MNKPLKILFVSAEVAPFAKRGGLGDVAGALPKALRELGHDVRVVMPAYQPIEQGYPGVEPHEETMFVPLGGTAIKTGVFESVLPDSDVPVYFIAEQNLFDRPEVYGYGDDVFRFAFFSRAALELTVMLDWQADILHAHDWHTAPAVMWLATAGRQLDHFKNMRSIFTIHNLAHQGKVSWDIVDYLGILTHSLSEEAYGEINFMARGIFHADWVTTVSPTYAKEISTLNGGAGLDGLLRHRGDRVSGILNGLDVDKWDPQTDSRLPVNYEFETLEQKLAVRHALQEAAGLPKRDNIPLLGLVSRLDWQKGLDLMGEVLHRLLNNWAGDAQVVVLGTGSAEYENMLGSMASYHSGKMTAILQYNAGFAPLIYGGSDMFLMPSLFEPCGLSQMISMRYGTLPIVRATGGLSDTVSDGETGFVFHDYSADAFWEAVARGIYVYNVDKPRWRLMQERGMKTDFSWTRSAESYTELYNNVLA